MTLFVASKICELYPAIYDVCLSEFFNVRSFRCLMFFEDCLCREESTMTTTTILDWNQE